MIEVLFSVWLAVVGVLLLSPVARKMSPWGGVFITPITATAVFTLIGLVLVAGGMFSVALAVALETIAALVVVVGVLRREGARRSLFVWILQVLGGAVVIGGVVAAVAWRFPMARFSTDSYHYLMSAAALVESGTLRGVIDTLLLKRQLATPLLHTLGVETGRGYVSFWTPLLGVSAFGSMAWLALDGLRKLSVPRALRWAIVLSGLAFTISTNRVMYHFFYINGHMLFAALLIGAVGLGWLAVRERSWVLLLPASVMFAALIPLRAEAMIVAAVFLVAFVSSQEVPIRWRWVLLGPTLAAVVLWDLWTLPRLLAKPSLGTLKGPFGDVIVAIGLVALVVIANRDRTGRIARYAPWATVGVAVVALALLTLTDPQILVDTIIGMSTGMTATGYWSAFWIVVLPLFVVAALIGFPGDRFIVPGIVAFGVALPIFAYLRGSPFGSHVGDSANRMVMHVVPLIVLAIMMAAGTAAGTLSRSGDEPAPGTEVLDDAPAGSPADR